ncbi:hypothetical protein PC116_g15929, partial [Phytophthora cactorum]
GCVTSWSFQDVPRVCCVVRSSCVAVPVKWES